MRVHTSYRTVILQLNPDEVAKKELHKSMESITKFLDMSRTDIQKLLYNRWKEMNEPYPGRSIALMVQRFSNFNKKEFTVFNSDNSKFVFDKEWFVEVQVRTKDNGHLVPRIKIPISRTEVPYYSDIRDMMGLPMMVVKENDKYFAYVQIATELTFSDLVVGIDFNYSKWVAAPTEGLPLFFDARGYGKEVEAISKKISALMSYKATLSNKEDINVVFTQLNDLYSQRTAVVKRAHGNFLSELEKKFGRCILAVEDPSKIYKLTNKGSKITNNWLNTKTVLGQFQLRALAHGFNIPEEGNVNPAYTSQVCHRCKHVGYFKGKQGRIFYCLNCGLNNYHRDLNAARNIAFACKREVAFMNMHKKMANLSDEEKHTLNSIFPAYHDIVAEIKTQKKDQT